MTLPDTLSPGHAAAVRWRVVCLCAQWCNVCRQYREDFVGLADRWPDVDFIWLDVEDESDVMQDIDVDTFPTLLLGYGENPVFMGALLPQVVVLERLLQSARKVPASLAPVTQQVRQLWSRVLQSRQN